MALYPRVRTSTLFANKLDSANRKLILLAPGSGEIPAKFDQSVYDAKLYDDLLAGMQRLRGSVYLEDGAISANELTADGRHLSSADSEAWHVLAVDNTGRVCGCARYLSHDNSTSFHDLVLKSSALAQDPQWGGRLQAAVESELALAQRMGVPYVEAGGWALDESARCSSEALRIALASYALARNLGGCVGISTVTVRHCSASILQKLGGQFLEHNGVAMPLYYDPQYQCDMAMLRFESGMANPRYEMWIEALRAHFRTVPVISRHCSGNSWLTLPQHRFACA